MSEHYEFTTQDMLHTFTTHVQGGSEADFFIWLTAHEEQIRQEERENITAAEQRGAERAFDEAVEEIASMEGNRLIIARYKHLNPYRADQEADGVV